MGYLPQLSEIDRERDMVREFRGLNHNEVISDGQFYDMQNLSSDAYPVLTARKPRTLCKTVASGSRMSAGEHMAWCDGQHFYYNGAQKFACAMPDNIVRMGAYFCLFPQGIVYNSHDDTVKNIAETVEATAQLQIYPAIKKIKPGGGWEISQADYVASETEPLNTSQYWLDTGNTPVVLKQYSKDFKIWVSVPTSLLGFSFIFNNDLPIGTFAQKFKAGDAVTISGLTGDLAELNSSFIINEVTLQGFVVEVNSFLLNIPSDFVTVSMKVERTFPAMDYVCECGNRLFGCSTAKHEIYASKLGDPLNWNVFSGISTDSYAATIGSPGEFTGIASYRSNVLFFKEDMIHVLSGTRPANFQIDTIECRGMQRGSNNSAAVVNETLFYKSDSGIMAYNGNLPELASDAFGEYNTGHVISAGTDGKKYYCCLVTGDDECHLMVYDVLRGIWTREDSIAVRDFSAIGNNLYMMYDGKIYDLHTGTSVETGEAWKDETLVDEKDVMWYATTGAIGLDSPYEKYIAALMLRVQMDSGGTIRVETSYDEENNFVEVARITADKLRSVTLNIVPRRCDTMRIRLSGRGKFKLFSISKEIEGGGSSDGSI
jgi:hypothetical protein